MDAKHFAREADRLLGDETLKLAFDAIRRDALEALASVDADDKTMILRLQAKIGVIDEIRADMRMAITRMAETANPAGTFA
jgi:uncharacterized protein (UPF0147 family)